MTDADGANQPGLITHRRVLKIALPLVLANATVPLLGAVDTGVVGQLGEAAPIGAVGVGAVVLSSVYWIFGFLRMGTVGLAGQAAGTGDQEEVARVLTRALLIAGAAGLLLIFGQRVIFSAAFALAPASDDVEALARGYMRIRIWSAPAAIAAFAMVGWLVAMERTAGVFWMQLLTNGLNIALSVVLGLQLNWGVAGVATASAISDIAGAALGLWLCRAAFQTPAWRDWAEVINRGKLGRLAKLNTNIFIRTALVNAVAISFLFVGARFGDVALAANQVLLQFMHITAHALDGFAHAAEALVARAFGRAIPSQLRHAAAMAGLWGTITSLALAVLFAVAGPLLIDVMATADDVRRAARTYLPWMVAMPLVGCAAWILDGVFIGATRSADMRNMMVLSTLFYLLVLLLLLPTFGNHGLWAATLLWLVARGATLGLRYPALERAAAR